MICTPEAFAADVRSVLEQLQLFSDAAQNLILLTAAHESGRFRYDRQQGGPALGLCQMEPATFHDLLDNGGGTRFCTPFLPAGRDLRDLDDLLDRRFAIAACRAQYRRFSEPLPAADNGPGLADYAKRYWNTHLGAATPEKYLADAQACYPDIFGTPALV